MSENLPNKQEGESPSKVKEILTEKNPLIKLLNSFKLKLGLVKVSSGDVIDSITEVEGTILGKKVVQVKIKNRDFIFYVDLETFKPLKIKLTNDLITQIGGEITLGGKKVVNIKINNREWVFVNPETLEKLQVKGTKGTDSIIRNIQFDHNKTIDARAVLVKTNDMLYDFYINPETLEPLKIKGTNDLITRILSWKTMLFGGNNAVPVQINNKSSCSDWIVVDLQTLELVKIKNINGIITYLGKETVLGGKRVVNAVIDNKDLFLINCDSLEKIELKVKGTDDVVTRIGEEIIIGGKRVVNIEINNREWVFVNPETLEKLQVKLNGTNEIITKIYEQESGKLQANDRAYAITNTNEEIEIGQYLSYEVLLKFHIN